MHATTTGVRLNAQRVVLFRGVEPGHPIKTNDRRLSFSVDGVSHAAFRNWLTLIVDEKDLRGAYGVIPKLTNAPERSAGVAFASTRAIRILAGRSIGSILIRFLIAVQRRDQQ